MSRHEEDDEQKAFIQWLTIKNIFFFSVPNGAVLKGNAMQRARQMNQLKASGFRNGVADVIVMIKDKVLFIEMKKKKGGRQSESQKQFEKDVSVFDYCEYFVANGSKEAIEIVSEINKG